MFGFISKQVIIFQTSKDGKQNIADKQIFLLKGEMLNQQCFIIDLLKANGIQKKEDIKSKQIKIRFFTVSLTEKNAQIRFHYERIPVVELFKHEIIISKTLDAFYGISLDQKADGKSEHFKSKKDQSRSPKYQTGILRLNKNKSLQYESVDYSYSPGLNFLKESPQKRISKFDKYSLKQLQKKRNDRHSYIQQPKSNQFKVQGVRKLNQGASYFQQSVNHQLRVQGLKKFKSFELKHPNNIVREEVDSLSSQKTYKIQNRQKQFEQLNRQKQKLRYQNNQLSFTVKNLVQKIDNLQKRRLKLQTKTIEADKQVKNALRSTREINNQHKQLQENVYKKQKKIKEAEHKMQLANKNFEKKQIIYKEEIKYLQNKIAQLGQQKQKKQFLCQNISQRLQQAQKSLNKRIEKQQKNEKLQILESNKKTAQIQNLLSIHIQKTKVLKSQNKSLQLKAEMISKQLSTKELSIQNFKDIISTQVSCIQKMKQEIKMLSKYRTQEERHQKNIKEIKFQFEKLYEQITFKDIQIKKVSKLKQLSEEQNERYKQDNAYLRIQMQEKLKQIKELSQENSKIQNQVNEIKFKFSDLQQKSKQLQKKIKFEQKISLQKQHQSLQQIQQLKRQTRQKQQQIQVRCYQLSKNKQQKQKQIKLIIKQKQQLIQRYESQVIDRETSYKKQLQIKLKIKSQEVQRLQEHKWRQNQLLIQKKYQKQLQALKSNHHNQIQKLQSNILLQTQQIKSQLHQNHNQQMKKYKLNLKQQKINKQALKRQNEEYKRLNEVLIKQKQQSQLQFVNKINQLNIIINNFREQIKRIKHNANEQQLKEENLIKQKQQLKVQKKKILDQITLKNNETLILQQNLTKANNKASQIQLKLSNQKEKFEKQLQNSKKLEKSLKIQLQQSIRFKQSPKKEKSQAEKILSNRIQNLSKKLVQKQQQMKNTEKQVIVLREKQIRLIQFMKVQFATHCKDDHKKLKEALERLQRVRSGQKVKQKLEAHPEVLKKLSSMEQQLENQKKNAQANLNKVKTKQIQIEGIKVKYKEYKEQNQKLAKQLETSQKNLKKYRNQVQNITISLGQVKKSLAKVQQHLSARGIPNNGNGVKTIQFIIAMKQAVRKVQAIALANTSTNSTISKMISQKASNVMNAYGLQSNIPSKNLKPDKLNFNDSRSMVNFNTKKVNEQKSKSYQKISGNLLAIPALTKKLTNYKQQQFFEEQNPNNHSIISTRSAVNPTFKEIKNSTNTKSNQNILQVKDKKNNDKLSKMSNSMIIEPNFKCNGENNKQSFDMEQKFFNSGESYEQNESSKAILNKSLLNDSLRNSSNRNQNTNNQHFSNKQSDNQNRENYQIKVKQADSRQVNSRQTQYNIEIVDLQENDQSFVLPTINIQQAKLYPDINSNSSQKQNQNEQSPLKCQQISIKNQQGSKPKISSPPQLQFFNDKSINEFSFV